MFSETKFFVIDSNYNNAENSAAISHFLYQQYEIKVKAEKDFMAVRQSQNLTPRDLKRAQTEKTVNVPGQRNCSQPIKQKKVSTDKLTGETNSILVYHINLPARVLLLS